MYKNNSRSVNNSYSTEYQRVLKEEDKRKSKILTKISLRNVGSWVMGSIVAVATSVLMMLVQQEFRLVVVPFSMALCISAVFAKIDPFVDEYCKNQPNTAYAKLASVQLGMGVAALVSLLGPAIAVLLSFGFAMVAILLFIMQLRHNEELYRESQQQAIRDANIKKPEEKENVKIEAEPATTSGTVEYDNYVIPEILEDSSIDEQGWWTDLKNMAESLGARIEMSPEEKENIETMEDKMRGVY